MLCGWSMACKDNFNINFIFFEGWVDHVPHLFSFWYSWHIWSLFFLLKAYLLFTIYTFSVFAFVIYFPIITHRFLPHLLGSLEHIYYRAVASSEKVCVWGGSMTFYTIIIVKLTCFIYQLARCSLDWATVFDRHVLKEVSL